MQLLEKEEQSREERSRRCLPHGLGRKVLRRSGWGYQKVHGRTYQGINPGYVKIWGPNGEVVDRALTIKTALRKIRRWEKEARWP